MATLTLRPTGDNSVGSIWYDTDLDQTNLYSHVDESSLNEADYNVIIGSPTTLTSILLYNWANHTTEEGVITDVIFYAQAKVVSGDSHFHFAIPDAGHLETQQTLTGTSTLYHQHFTTNPHTGSAWTWGEIDALTAGFQATVEYQYYNAEVYQTYIEVVYTPESTFTPSIIIF